MVTVGGTFWVCIDCMLSYANDEENEDRPDTEPEVWALWKDDSHEIAMGGEHLADCPQLEDPSDCNCSDCDCEHLTFSYSPCEGCGSNLGGDRFAFTWFE